MAEGFFSFGLQATLLAVPPGGSLAILVKPVAGQVSAVLKKFGGGSLEIYNAPVGATAADPTAIDTLGTGYLMGIAEERLIYGSPKFYLAATGTTATAYLLLGIGPMSSLGG